MLKKYKNGFIDIIKEYGLDPGVFIGEEVRHANLDSVFIIRVAGTELTFETRNLPDDPHGFDCRHNRSALIHDSETESSYTTGTRPISIIYGYFKKWLTNYALPYINDLSEPDLWSQIGGNPPSPGHLMIGDDETRQFSTGEKQQMKLSMEEFRALLVNRFGPSADALSAIDDRLSYLADAAERLNRFDWRGVALSSLISISGALCLDAQEGKELFEMFKHVFEKVTLQLK